MAKNISNPKSKPNNQNTPPVVTFRRHHYFRTIIASFFGFIALNLIIASILVYWLSSTLTNSDKFTNTVAPIVNKPSVQNFVANKVTDQILDNKDIPLQDLSTQVLGAEASVGKTPEQLKVQLKPVIKDSVKQVTASPEFAQLWTSTLKSAHQQFTNSFEHPGSDITLDLHPVIVGVLDELGKTKLAPVKDKLKIKDDAGKLTIGSNDINNKDFLGFKDKRDIYNKLKKVSPILIITAFVFAGLSILASVHHLKTLRRITFSTGIFTGILALALKAPSFVNLKGSKDLDADFLKAVIGTLTAGLEKMLVIISITCLAVAIGSKIYSIARARYKHPKANLKNFR